ncbi:MAG: hypothetical protein HY619_02535 [Thaumarchaeota archaeon]|nr:hypothetical protein [Nitrososphaerota archaeon]
MHSTPFPQDAGSMIRIDSEVLKRHEELYMFSKVIGVKVLADHDTGNALHHLRQSFTIRLEELKDHPVVRAFRDFYWRIGIDPTKVRPASEALARRFLSYGALPRINSVVDAGNFASVETLIPIGIYDMDHIRGEPVLRMAREGESMVDISQAERRLGNNDIVLADEDGPLHIFPHRDSRRSMVTMETKLVLVVGCGVKGVDSSLVSKVVDRTLELCTQFAR